MYRDPKPDGVDMTVAGELRATKWTNVVMFHVPINGAAVVCESLNLYPWTCPKVMYSSVPIMKWFNSLLLLLLLLLMYSEWNCSGTSLVQMDYSMFSGPPRVTLQLLHSLFFSTIHLSISASVIRVIVLLFSVLLQAMSCGVVYCLFGVCRFWWCPVPYLQPGRRENKN